MLKLIGSDVCSLQMQERRPRRSPCWARPLQETAPGEVGVYVLGADPALGRCPAKRPSRLATRWAPGVTRWAGASCSRITVRLCS